MKQFPVKQDDVGDQYPAEDYNSSMEELNNFVVTSGQTLDEIKTDQLSGAVAGYSAAGDFYIDTGTANSYLLSAADARVGLKNLPTGALLRFVPVNTNTGASTATVNGLTFKSIKTVHGTDLEAGAIISGVYTSIVYDGTNFILLNSGSSFVTGMVTHYIGASLSGFLRMEDQTFGSLASTATVKDNATESLFKLLWESIPDAWAPVVGGRGGTADADWTANKAITLPRTLGRALSNAGAGAGLTSRAIGEYLGEEDHTLTEAQLAEHLHGSAFSSVQGGKYGDFPGTFNIDFTTLGGTSAATKNSSTTGGGDPHNNMQPSSFLNFFIKL